MAAVREPVIEPGEGTPETEWLPWIAAQEFLPLDVERRFSPTAVVVMVAPHPDDEILTAGGLLAQLAQLGRRIRIVAVSDGEASHAGSTAWPPERLAHERPLESRRALARLGLNVQPIRLGLPDGELAHMVRSIARRVSEICRQGDLLLTTWRGDGHPDHAATALGCSLAASRIDASVVEVPVWAWHWAAPGDRRVPWKRARIQPLDAETRRRKTLAMQEFHSQLSGDASTGQAPVLRASTLARSARPFEVFFV